MSPRSADADKALMEAVLRQLDGKLDYQRLACDLGIDKPGTAWKRWSVFKKRLGAGAPTSPAAVRVVKGPVATPPKTTNVRVRGKQGKASKKRKLVASDEEDDEIDFQIKEDEDGGEDGTWIGALPEMPSRRLSVRKARVITFKEGPSETEHDEPGEDFADSGRGSGHGASDEREI